MQEKELKAVTIDKEESKILDAFRHIRKLQHGDLQVSVKNGSTVKLWTTDKWDLDEVPKLREQAQ